MAEIKKYLQERGINFKVIKHPAIYTCEQAERLVKNLAKIHSKNLFLRDKKTRKYYLVILPFDERLNIKEFEKRLNTKLSFAKPEQLKEVLGLTPGAVSPFGLINDKKNLVEVLIRKKIFDSAVVGFHPNINTETLEITKEDFHKYLNLLKNKITII
ncbi:MAG: prolyl-tRNA synthetase associated domain-containing protein [Nanoarchaeota archaeon]|nr:prolyl-tRNA synthetase associated domain-containing protein [Nanoarchaeota archaeon]